MTKKTNSEEIEIKVARILRELGGAQQTIKNLKARTNKLEEQLDHYAKRKHDLLLDKVETRGREADRRQLASIYRTAALTEVSWYLRRTSPDSLPRVQDGMIILFDRPDRWWLSAEKRTIAQWIDLAIEAKKPTEFGSMSRSGAATGAITENA